MSRRQPWADRPATFTYEWNYDGDLIAECEVEYTPECLGHGSHPDEHAYCTVGDVKVGGQSIYELLSHKQIEHIEEMAFNRRESDWQEATDEAHIEAFISRMDA